MLVVMPTHAQFPPIPAPEKYAGDPAQCKGFLLQCFLFFASYPVMPETRKVTHFMELLTGKALFWATAVWEQGGESMSSLEQLDVGQLQLGPAWLSEEKREECS